MEQKKSIEGVLAERVNFTGGLTGIKIKTFAEKLTTAVGALFHCLVSDKTIREHPVWGKLIPFEVPTYGNGNSVGHCIRPDLVVTEDGKIKICELDCAPSGRGFLLKMIEGYPQEREKYLELFQAWYKSISRNPHIIYATGTQTVCYEETNLFARELRKYCTGIFAENVDTLRVNIGTLIDRLFYRSELHGNEKFFPHNNVITAEPYLDSKMILALVHDSNLETYLKDRLGIENFVFLKDAIPETYSLDLLRLKHSYTKASLKTADLLGLNSEIKASIEKYPAQILEDLYAVVKRDATAERSNWLIKTGEVESNISWGSRSVVLGCRCGAQEFTQLLQGHVLTSGKNNSQKNIGGRPILQRFHKSKDFGELWNAVIKDEIPGLYERTNPFFTDEVFKDEHVYARVTFFMLLDMVQGNHSHTSVGELTLRKQPLAHGATDAMYVPFILS